jgi:hypothetical protein
MATKDYHTNEMLLHAKLVREVEAASLADRKAAREEFRADLLDLASLRMGVEYMLNGSYGYAAMIKAQEVAENKRLNRAAGLGALLAMYEHRCPARFAADAFNSLTAEQQEAANALILGLADEYLAELAEEHAA